MNPPIHSSSQTNGKKRTKSIACLSLNSLISPSFCTQPLKNREIFHFIRLEPYKTTIFVSLKYSNFSNVFYFSAEMASELMINNIQCN